MKNSEEKKRQELKQSGELTVEKARELLNDNTRSDEQLQHIINKVKIFCKVAYELYSQEQDQADNINEEPTKVIQLYPDPLKLAA